MNSASRHFVVEGAGSTYVHPLGLMMLLICGGMLIILPRRYAVWGFIALVCFVSARQAIAIAGFNFYFPRVMVLVFGVARALLKGDAPRLRWNRLDSLVLVFGIWYFSAGAITWHFSAAEMKVRSGYITEMVGTYFLFRMLLQTVEDIKTAVLGLSLASLPLIAFFLIEHMTGRNLFSMFGGVPEITAVREGRLRCQGPFGHPILAGTFWATMLSLMMAGVLGRWRYRYWFAAGVCAAVGIVVLTASSTPVLGVATGILGWCAFPLRKFTRYAFYALGALLIVLHMVMDGPVWSLIAHIDLTPGNSAYHRYMIVNGFLTHVEEWWLTGSSVGTDHWGYFAFDTANQFVQVGVASGLLGLALFSSIIVVAMRGVGRATGETPHLAWGVGVSIFALSVCFFGIGIWGQLHFAWALPTAMAGSLGFGERENLSEMQRTDMQQFVQDSTEAPKAGWAVRGAAGQSVGVERGANVWQA